MNKNTLLLTLLLFPVVAMAQEQDLAIPQFQHIQFPKITPSSFSNDSEALVIDVNNSSSALVYGFMQPRKISEVSFLWKSKGRLKVRSRKQEASRAGDDSYFRLGLFVEGKQVEIPFFAPHWIKQTRRHLKLPTDKILYLVVGAQHPAGDMWASPYTKSIKMMSIKSVAAGNGFYRAHVRFEAPVRTVGLWLMADGDNTGSRFTTTIKNLHLK